MPFRGIKNCLETASAPWYAYPAFACFSKKIKTLAQRAWVTWLRNNETIIFDAK